MKRFNLSWLILTAVFCLFLFNHSFTGFFTNDDFYFLNISRAENVKQFVDFFNPLTVYKGQAMYRPLTTQAFYFFGRSVLAMNPIYMHIFSFVCFMLLVYLIYLFSLKISKSKSISILTSFLYATSATHFGHFYYLSTFQEIGVGIFIFLSVILFIEYLYNNKSKHYIFSLLAFILGLLSKETAVIVPAFIILLGLYLKKFKLVHYLPYIIILGLYLLARIYFYGITKGDTYIWDFSPRIINTLGWYSAWSLNIPESFIDFVGPGLKINPNLLKYWRSETITIISTFVSFSLTLTILFAKKIKIFLKKYNGTLIFSVSLFVLGLLPVVFLPIHKFSYYLTISIFPVTFLISIILDQYKKLTKIVVILLWIFGSFSTLSYTLDTSWISRGSQISYKVKQYFDDKSFTGNTNYVYFYDTVKDKELPWSPTEVVLNAISGDDFFAVYYPNKTIIIPNKSGHIHDNLIEVESRQFLGY